MFMRMRRMLLLLLCLAFLPCQALSGQLLEGPAAIPGAQAPAGVASQTETASLPNLLDDLPFTFWQRTTHSPSGADLQLTPADPTLAAVWLRSGNCTSPAQYQSYARPAIIRVGVHYTQGGTEYLAQYRYALSDACRPDARELLWQSGYQCLSLPQLFHSVTRVDLTVETWTQGDVYLSEGCISDVLLSSQPPALPATPVPLCTATATPRPTPTPKPTYKPAASGDANTVIYSSEGVSAPLLMRMATRSGPGTEYDELGSYFKEGYEVTVLSITYDGNDVPWVQVEFTYQGSLRRAYTGLKRVGVDPALLREEASMGNAEIIQKATPRYGPGKEYTPRKFDVRKGTAGTVWAVENGWVQFEFFARADDCYYRVWVPESSVRYKK